MNKEDQIAFDQLIKNRRARQLAYAVLQRAKEALIPQDFLRIDEKTFASILCSNYHNNAAKFASSIYNGPNFLDNKFIVVDGGGAIPTSRKMAGFAILFLAIANDLRGSYIDCDGLRHKLQSIRATEEIMRNDLVEEYKSYDVLFLSEVDRSKFTPHFESGNFFDEILNYRSDHSKPTIISFYNPVAGKDNKSQEQLAAEGKLSLSCGKFLSALSLESESGKGILRIRVKAI